MRENRPSGSEGGVAFGPSLPLSGPFVNPPWGKSTWPKRSLPILRGWHSVFGLGHSG